MTDLTEKHIVAIDLGTSKIALTVAKVSGDDVQIVYHNWKDTPPIRRKAYFIPQKRGYQRAIFAPKQQSGIIAESSPQIFNFRRLSLQSAVAECCQ